jgi:hypothetical protein
MIVEYLEALHLEDKKRTSALLKKLNSYKGGEKAKKPKKTKSTTKKRKAEEEIDCHLLDEQIKDDIAMVKLFAVAGLFVVYIHFGVI